MKMIGGPDNYWSSEHPVSRGQWRDLAEQACRLLSVDVPKSRYDATVLQARMRAAAVEKVPDLPEPEAF